MNIQCSDKWTRWLPCIPKTSEAERAVHGASASKSQQTRDVPRVRLAKQRRCALKGALLQAGRHSQSHPPTQTPWQWTAKLAWLALVLGLMANASLDLRAQEANGWKITKTGGVRFAMVDLFVDSGQTPLAAYQLRFAASQGEVKIAGIEGGDHPAFKTPPYYDPKAMRNERVILAAFSTAQTDRLPQGKVRVATLHLQLTGTKNPKFELNLQTAAASSGKTIAAKVTLTERATP